MVSASLRPIQVVNRLTCISRVAICFHVNGKYQPQTNKQTKTFIVLFPNCRPNCPGEKNENIFKSV